MVVGMSTHFGASTVDGAGGTVVQPAPSVAGVGAGGRLGAVRPTAVSAEMQMDATQVNSVAARVLVPAAGTGAPQGAPVQPAPGAAPTLEFHALAPVGLYRTLFDGSRREIKTNERQRDELNATRQKLYNRLIELGHPLQGVDFSINASAASCSYEAEGKKHRIDLIAIANSPETADVLEILEEYREVVEHISPGNVWKKFAANQVGDVGGAAPLAKPEKPQGVLEALVPSERLHKLPETLAKFIEKGYLPQVADQAKQKDRLRRYQSLHNGFIKKLEALEKSKEQALKAITDPAEAAQKTQLASELAELAALKQTLESSDNFAMMMALSYADPTADATARAEMAVDAAQTNMLEQSRPWFGWGSSAPLNNKEREYFADMGMLFIRDRLDYLAWCHTKGIHAKKDPKELYALLDAILALDNGDEDSALDRLRSILPDSLRNEETDEWLREISELPPAPAQPGLVHTQSNTPQRPARAPAAASSVSDDDSSDDDGIRLTTPASGLRVHTESSVPPRPARASAPVPAAATPAFRFDLDPFFNYSPRPTLAGAAALRGDDSDDGDEIIITAGNRQAQADRQAGHVPVSMRSLESLLLGHAGKG